MCVIEIHAQKMYVESFVEKTNDITARRYPRTDFVGDDCALVKVLLAASGAVFEGNVVDDVSYHTSEYYVYMVQDSKRLTVKLEGYLPLEVNFEDFGFRSLEGKTVYLLTISGVSSAQHFESPKIKTGWIVLDSEPSGASVYINNEFVGYTPLSNYKQAYGTYQYRLESPNYHPSTGIIELNAGRFEQKVVLKPAFGSIFVNSNVAGAKIILDGKQTGRQTPATLSEIPSGPHTITLQMDKYAPRQQNVIVEDGQTTDVSLTLEARFARVTINSLSGAEIYCNGKLLGRRGRISEDMMEGYYDLEARLAHHRSVTKQIQVVVGQSQDITLNPIPKYGSLDVVSTPHDATVTIDGKTMGKTPLTIEQLLEGEHQVAISLEGYKKEMRNVVVVENNSSLVEIALTKDTPIRRQDPSPSRTRSKDAWFVFGTVSELVRENIIVNNGKLRSDYNKDYFTKIDINIDKVIKFYSKYVKILTNHPISSYTLKRDANEQYMLQINDPDYFWSINDHLVVLVSDYPIPDLGSFQQDNRNSNKTYDVVEEMPQFPGGNSALMEYLARNVKYPVVAEENGIQGRVVCRFIVERDGSITDVRVVRSVDPSLDREAMRVIKSMPHWIPGKQNGSPVRAEYTLPITFYFQ